MFSEFSKLLLKGFLTPKSYPKLVCGISITSSISLISSASSIFSYGFSKNSSVYSFSGFSSTNVSSTSSIPVNSFVVFSTVSSVFCGTFMILLIVSTSSCTSSVGSKISSVFS